jgi:hypothetical protein
MRAIVDVYNPDMFVFEGNPVVKRFHLGCVLGNQRISDKKHGDCQQSVGHCSPQGSLRRKED